MYYVLLRYSIWCLQSSHVLECRQASAIQSFPVSKRLHAKRGCCNILTVLSCTPLKGSWALRSLCGCQWGWVGCRGRGHNPGSVWHQWLWGRHGTDQISTNGNRPAHINSSTLGIGWLHSEICADETVEGVSPLAKPFSSIPVLV